MNEATFKGIVTIVLKQHNIILSQNFGKLELFVFILSDNEDSYGKIESTLLNFQEKDKRYEALVQKFKQLKKIVKGEDDKQR